MARDHWHRAALQWQRVGQPLRPAPADIRQIMPLFTACDSARAVLLGVTPEIARAASSAGVPMIAVDRNIEMIQHVWPRTDVENGAALCCDWSSIPLASCSWSCVVGDGCFTLMGYPDGYRRVFAEVHRLLRPEGRFAMRFFSRPAVAEDLAQVADDLHHGRIGNIHALKWRVAMSMQATIEQGVAADKLWHALDAMVLEREKLERITGWNRQEIDTFDVFRGSPAKFTFPNLEEIRAISNPLFQEVSIHYPDYELGSVCPTLIYTRRR